MPLSNEQIKKIVSQRRANQEVIKGKKHQERLRFHTETVLDKYDLSNYYHDFLRWIGSREYDPTGMTPELLAKDKFNRIKHLIKAPIQTVELTESIYSRLYRVFSAQDSYFNYKFSDDSLEADWAEYRDDKFWSTIGFQAMQTAIDSVWIPVLPENQVTDFPEPANKLIDIENVIDIKNDEYNNCLHVIFKFGEYIYVYDDASFRVFQAEGYEIKGDPIADVPHDLGYTPARMFWSERLTARNNINKEAPITKELTDLDWLLFHMTSKRYMDVANGFPITVTYELDDDYEDDNITENEQRIEGERPSGGDLTGAGSHIKAPAPRNNEEHDAMQYGPIKIIAPPVESLRWHVEEEKRLIDKIFKAVVGVDQESRNDAAKNEKQIDSAFESQLSVLYRIKKNFEAIHKFADSTICKLRYGDRFIDCDIDYGTNFFLKDVDDLQEELAEARESGASAAIIEAINDNITRTKYRDDKNSILRADIINQLDPLPNYSIKDAIEIYKNGGVDKINFIIKCNLNNFVKRFERENIDIVKFGSLGSFERKIEVIRQKFIEYAKAQIDTKEQIDETISREPGIT